MESSHLQLPRNTPQSTCSRRAKSTPTRAGRRRNGSSSSQGRTGPSRSCSGPRNGGAGSITPIPRGLRGAGPLPRRRRSRLARRNLSQRQDCSGCGCGFAAIFLRKRGRGKQIRNRALGEAESGPKARRMDHTHRRHIRHGGGRRTCLALIVALLLSMRFSSRVLEGRPCKTSEKVPAKKTNAGLFEMVFPNRMLRHRISYCFRVNFRVLVNERLRVVTKFMVVLWTAARALPSSLVGRSWSPLSGPFGAFLSTRGDLLKGIFVMYVRTTLGGRHRPFLVECASASPS